MFLKEEDQIRDQNRKDGDQPRFDKDGNYLNGFGPGSEDWAGRMLTLRGQSFVKGSQYRKTTAEQQWGVLGEKYKTNRKNWRIANPEKNDNDNDDDDDETGNFLHINKGGYAKLDGESIQKGSLEGIRTNVQSRKGFYIGDNNFRPDGKNGWIKETPDGVKTKYRSVSELIKSGFRTTDKGFTSLITMDYNDDDKPDAGPFKPIDLTFS